MLGAEPALNSAGKRYSWASRCYIRIKDETTKHFFFFFAVNYLSPIHIFSISVKRTNTSCVKINRDEPRHSPSPINPYLRPNPNGATWADTSDLVFIVLSILCQTKRIKKIHQNYLCRSTVSSACIASARTANLPLASSRTFSHSPLVWPMLLSRLTPGSFK